MDKTPASPASPEPMSPGKKALRTAGLLFLTVLFGGGALLFFSIFALLSGMNLSLMQSVLAAGAAALAAFVLCSSGYLGPRGRRWVLGLLACALVAAAGYGGYGLWREHLPTVDDRSLMLYQYDPYREDSKAVRLREDSTLQFQRGQRLRMDGATALYPVYAAFYQAVYPDAQYGALLDCTGTIDAYRRLLKREVDVIFAAGPSQAQLEEAERQGMTLHLTPIGKEAFVFFVNSKNPVADLTVEQIQGIYTGEIVNWKELGGKNWSIRPFQRAENSGSQTALEKLMDGLPLLEPEMEDRVAAMSGIIREVASYRNYKNAIGFSFRFYATEMARNDAIRLLALNGVAPTQETIRDGSYPIVSDFYAVTAAPAGQPAPQEADPDLAALLAWILSDQGQTIVEETGYVSLQ